MAKTAARWRPPLTHGTALKVRQRQVEDVDLLLATVLHGLLRTLLRLQRLGAAGHHQAQRGAALPAAREQQGSAVSGDITATLAFCKASASSQTASTQQTR